MPIRTSLIFHLPPVAILVGRISFCCRKSSFAFRSAKAALTSRYFRGAKGDDLARAWQAEPTSSLPSWNQARQCRSSPGR